MHRAHLALARVGRQGADLCCRHAENRRVALGRVRRRRHAALCRRHLGAERRGIALGAGGLLGLGGGQLAGARRQFRIKPALSKQQAAPRHIALHRIPLTSAVAAAARSCCAGVCASLKASLAASCRDPGRGDARAPRSMDCSITAAPPRAPRPAAAARRLGNACYKRGTSARGACTSAGSGQSRRRGLTAARRREGRFKRREWDYGQSEKQLQVR